jgi:hypothetical protein
MYPRLVIYSYSLLIEGVSGDVPKAERGVAFRGGGS